jgi:hypothetical protein
MSILYTEQEIQNLGLTKTQKTEEDEQLQDSSILFTEEEVQADAELRSTNYVEPEPEIVTTKQRLAQQTEAALDTSMSEAPTEPVSMQSLIEDDQFVEDILQYRKDRFGVEKDVGGASLIFGYAFGEEELTNENIVDDYMDHYRFLTGNSVDAAMEVGWLESLTEKEKELEAQIGLAEGNERIDLIDQVNNITEQKARALRLYKRADSVAGLFNSTRYEGMDAGEMIDDIGSTIGANVLAGLSDPITALTAGIGRVVGGAAASAGVSPFRSAIIAAATTAPIEAGGAASVDLTVQRAELEMGARDEIDYERTALVAGTAALISGTLAYKGTKNTATRVDKATRGELSDALKNVQKEQTKLAEEANERLGAESATIRNRLAENIEATYGKEAILRNKDGSVKGLNGKFLRESEAAKKTAADLEIDEELYQPALSYSTFERVTASIGELVEGIRKGDIKIDAEKLRNLDIEVNKVGLKPEDLVAPLQKNEMVSERLINILNSTADESFNVTTGILGKYGVTQRELAATMFADASEAGRRLGKLSNLSKVVGRATRSKSAEQLAEETEDLATKNLGKTFRRLEDIRRLTLVSGVGTAVRNNLSQVIRSGVDTLVYSLESAINPNKKFGLRSTLAQLEHTFYDPKDAATISQFLLDLNTTQKKRFYNMVQEVANPLNRANPGQAATAGQGTGLQSSTPILDRWESIINAFNGLNRYQEAIYRQGMFTTSIQRQLFDNGLDMMTVLRSGNITQNIPEDMIAKAVDDALDFTYASQPEWSFFRNMNNLIVNSGATLAIPFPRFMFKAMEMTYNYNITGVAHGMRKVLMSKFKGQAVPDREFRRIAEGIAGGLPLLALGYVLRDPDGQSAGSEWYMLKDGKGNEFDARPFFPLTPYLLFGEMIHRYTDERYAGGVFKWKEAVEGLTGANFRGTGAASRMLEDFFAVGTDDTTELEFNLTLKELGGYLGEALSGYGQPAYQLADVFSDNYQRMRDYKTDLDSGESEGYVRNLESFFSGVFQPFKTRLGRVAEGLGETFNIESFSQEDVPFKEDPRSDDVPERVLPFMKIMFGATLNRVPPDYIQELSRMGFKYTDFMARTNSADIDRYINREMGILMNREMPEAIATAKQIHPDDGDKQASLIKEYISDMKSSLYAKVKIGEDEVAEQAMLQRFLRMSPYHRRAAIKQWKDDTGKEPDLKDADTLNTLLEWGSYSKFLANQRPK